MKSNVSPCINESTKKRLALLFKNTNSGATFVLESFPHIFKATLGEIKGKFTPGELDLIIDACEGLELLPVLPGMQASLHIENIIEKDGLVGGDSKSGEDVLKKISSLSISQKSMLEIWACACWHRQKTGQKIGPWIGQLS